MNTQSNNQTPLFAIGRALLGALFLVSGIGKIFGFAGVAGWMASAGLPFASAFLVATIAIEVIGGLLLIIGWQSRWAALALAAFLVPVTAVFHGFWSADDAHFQEQLTAFLKNAAILGGMLLVFERGIRKPQ
ncbi:DoxX family protein [Lysobacter niastensis]|uniref:DoxX family protein n=1 Tax=Lysobacter niastensis TaxID=380629 RepID=A0ABS0B3R9_9GAMM|nr:DoxX family protein [Lysobacter niastensis]MBF6023124.1 DoxX family protein [Lysobacter niastensis]